MINPNFIFGKHYTWFFKEDRDTLNLFSESKQDVDGLVYSKDGQICLPYCNREVDKHDKINDHYIWVVKREDTRERNNKDRILFRIKSGVKIIYDGAFDGIHDADIIIPSSVEYIGAAFQYCKNILLIFEGEVPSYGHFDSDAFFHSSNISVKCDYSIVGNQHFPKDLLEKCFIISACLLTFSNEYIEDLIKYTTGDKDTDYLKGIITIPSVHSINNGILHGAAVVDMRRYYGSTKNLLSFFYHDGEYDPYEDWEKCRYVVVNEKQAGTLPDEIEYLRVINLERQSTDIIGIIDYDKRFQRQDHDIVYSPERNRAIKAAGSKILYDHRYQMSDPFTNGKKASIHFGTKVICDYAFAMWSDLEEITIPSSVVRIGAGAFYGCNSLRSIVIPEGVETIEEDTFAECHWLEKVYLPSTLKEIRKGAFSNCSSLTEIVIPESVSFCDEHAFEGCLIEKCSGPIKNNETGVEYDSPFHEGRHWDAFFPGWKRKEYLKAISQFSYNNLLIHENAFYVFIDTETSGLPVNSNAPSYDIENWPRLVQLGWIVTNRNGEVLSSNNRLVFPVDYEIEEGAIEVHHITNEKARRDGEPLIEVLEDLIIDLRSAAFIVGHNIDFDKKIIGAEMIRCGMPDIIGPLPSIDTMKMGLQFTDLKDIRGRQKNPNLTELYSTLFGEEQRNAHDALGDVKATLACFFEMKSQLYFNANSFRIHKGKITENRALIANLVSARIRDMITDDGRELCVSLFWRKGIPINLLLRGTTPPRGTKIDPGSIEVIDCVVENGKRKYVASLQFE